MSDQPNTLVTSALDKLASGNDLSAEEAASVLAEIMAGEVTHAQIAGFLIGLRTKGETVAEITGLARTMRALATPVRVARDGLVDTAGTGGGRSTFNVSTTAALIAAAAGCAVAKHGNRSATSRSGSADLLEALGARIDLTPEQVARCIEEVGFGFIFAPAHHQATRFVIPVRRDLGVRTIFNFLGPLTNPAGARRQLVGVGDRAYQETLAGALAELGVERALVVASEDGLDEISASGPTRVIEVNGERIDEYTLEPHDLEIEPVAGDGLEGGDPAHNAGVTRAILSGAAGPARELAVANAAATIYAAGQAASLRDGARAARAALDDGRALATLETYIAASNA
jgi:anthranilate phosphoribosyltransferase